MRAPILLPLAILLLAGCATPEPAPPPAAFSGDLAPAPAAEADPAPPEPHVMVEVHLSGTILLRPAADPVATGDAPEFTFTVPPGARSLRAHAEWSPAQVMGLEFQPPQGERVRSWDAAPNTQLHPPIDLVIPGELPAGDWWAYVGPSTVGGAVSWDLTLALEVPASEAAALRVEGCTPRVLPALAPRAC